MRWHRKPSFPPIENGRVHENGMAQEGFTLLELLVYIAISSIVVVIAGQVWIEFTKSSKRTSDRMDAYQDMEQALFYLDEDISRAGSKSNSRGQGMQMVTDVLMDASSQDSSSISFVNGTDSTDELYFKAAVFSADSSLYEGYDSVYYTVNEDKELIRTSVFVDLDGTPGSALTQVIMDSIVVFDLEFGVYSSEGGAMASLGVIDSMHEDRLEWLDFWTSAAGPDNTPNLTSRVQDGIGFVDVTNLDYGDNTLADTNMFAVQNSANTNRKQFNDNGNGIEAGKTYKVSFSTIADEDFVDNFDMTKDSLSLVIRKLSTDYAPMDGVPEQFFYPGVAGKKYDREFQFTSSVTEANPSVYFRFNLKSDLSAGTISLGPLTMEEVNSGTYSFLSDFNDADSVMYKQNTRSMTLRLKVDHGSSVGLQEQVYTLRKFIQLPNNGVR